MRTFVALAALLATTAAAFAQAPPSTQPPVPVQGTVRCAPVQPPVAGQGTAPAQQTTGQSREPLSDRLAQSGGVICPPTEVDRQMQKQPPDEGNTPVIPPPGSPGGDPTVRPK